MSESVKANDQVNPDAAQGVPCENTNSAARVERFVRFPAINPFKQFDGRAIEQTEYLGGALWLHFTDGTSGVVDIVVPTDKISVREMIDYQAKGILVLSGGMK